MRVILLSEIGAAPAALVGGKAAGLAELLRHGERVPPGFCVTTGALRSGDLPRAQILAAYHRLGGGPVAVRSSATAEDLPDASFAGQYDTVLGVTGDDDLIAAVQRCRDSLHGARAVAYRRAHGIDDATVRMAVVVQRMVGAATAGVLCTANPLTGRRTEMLVDAAPGPGSTVVDGRSAVDHHVLDGSVPGPGSGCLTPAQLTGLRSTGERLQRLLGAPQEVEWAIDPDGAVWLLQSRPITTLFPLPPPAAGPQPRVYLEFGHVQGLRQPVTPMGMATLRQVVAAMAAAIGLRVEVIDIGGRLYGDLSDLARSRSARRRLVRLIAVDFGPRAQAVMRHVLADPRFAPGSGTGHGAGPRPPGDRRAAPRTAGPRRPGDRRAALRTAGSAVAGITSALARPDAARRRLFRAVETLRHESAAPAGPQTAAQRLRFVRDDDGAADAAAAITWPIVAGMLASTAAAPLLEGVADDGEIHTVLGGVPHNVTIEMDLAIWRLAEAAAPGHRRLLLQTPPAELAARHLRGDLPEFGLTGFLRAYGHRGVAEADLGVPRWAEDPAPVLAAVANCLRVTDPEQAPDRRFARAAGTAEATLDALAARARRRRPVRGRIAVFLLRRARALAGLREAGKFAGLYRLQAVREQLLLIGADLAGAGRLGEAGDIMYLTLDEASSAVHEGTDHRQTAARRRAVHRGESRRRAVPVALLSDGTDVESLLPSPPAADGVLRGVGAAAGHATGPARVVHDPATAHVEPGDVLVTATTDPGWTPLFLTAAALVTETGAVMAHGPTVAREYGIPAVISVPGATERIRTGQIVTVDGTAGTVSLGTPDAAGAGTGPLRTAGTGPAGAGPAGVS